MCFAWAMVPSGSWWMRRCCWDLTEEMDAVLVDPLKTTIVQDYRCMTTWVTRKRRISGAAQGGEIRA